MVSSLKSERADLERFRRVLRQLREHLAYSASLSGLTLPGLPVLRTIGEIKVFCDLIDSNIYHPWREWLNQQEERPAFTFAHSLFLFRKLLPGGSRKEAEKKFLDKMTLPAGPVDPDFLDFCRSEIRRLFPIGWDRHYRKKCHNFVLSTSSCLQASRIDLGARGLDSSLVRSAFQKAVGLEPFADKDHQARVCAVPSGGKWRVVTINSGECEGLKPYHHLLYDHLSGFDWLCRGSPKVKSFFRKKDEVFTSGDYESATDAIPLSLYRYLLGIVNERSVNVPESVKEFAMKDSKKVFINKEGHFLGNQERGQLMGSYLSFPFLCLLNYLCFRYSIRRNVPVLINGDDIVFRSTKEESERWMENVKRCGLILSRGKTLVHPRIFTLNSLLFRGGYSKGKAMGFFRPKAFFSCPRTGSAAAGQFNSCVVGFPGHKVKREIRVAFLKEYKNFLFKRQISLHGLGFRVSEVELRMSGFLHHERFYTKEKVPHLCGPVIPGGFRKLPYPKGKQDRRDARSSEKLFFREIMELSWLPGQKRSEVEEVFGTTRMPPKPKPGLVRSLGRLVTSLRCNNLRKKGSKLYELQQEKRRTYWGRPVFSTGPIQWVRGEVMNPHNCAMNYEDEVIFVGRRR
uniref:RNA dependent RNA polymerase n=1 Tax=Erysiphe necator associated ourmia-like virus 8 TaxID=2689566 RepID=A0A6B9KAQ3_9VIRU|nr:RNA dependent RNA polymerase [Erysiphe necator associated ourmia-like virus 8]